jgi:hypothetical protein
MSALLRLAASSSNFLKVGSRTVREERRIVYGWDLEIRFDRWSGLLKFRGDRLAALKAALD